MPQTSAKPSPSASEGPRWRSGSDSIIRALALILVALLPRMASAQAIDSDTVDAIMEESLKAWQVPGAALAVVRNDEVIYLKGYGVRDLESRQPVNPDTLFPIASCTKAFTSTAIACLVDDGKMSWDDPVRKHLDFFRLNDPLADANVTIRDLLCHRTGLSRHDLIGHMSPLSREEIIRRIPYLKPTYSFRSTYQYNNLMYLTAGYAAARTAGGSWEDLVQKRLLDPLGMKTVNFSVTVMEKNANHARPHRKNKQGKIEQLPLESIDNVGPAGCMNANVRELTRWVRLQLGDGTFEGKRLVSAANLADTHMPQMIIPLSGLEKDLNPESMQKSYGLAWAVQDYRGQPIVTHTGGLSGYRCRILLLPKSKIGIILLTNTSIGISGASMHTSAVYNLVDHLLKLPKKDWDAYYLDQVKQYNDRHQEQVAKRQAARHKNTKPSRELAAYAGTYEEPAYGKAVVTVDGDALHLQWSSFKDKLQHFHFDTFDIHSDDLIDDEEVLFRLDSAGDVAIMHFLGVDFKKVK